MAPEMKAPGVYIVENSAFPNSVEQVATAVPAFIGYTEKAMHGEQSLDGKPWRITSLAEYHTHFGGPPPLSFTLTRSPIPAPGTDLDEELDTDDPYPARIPEAVAQAGTQQYHLSRTGTRYHLYHSMVAFFGNGGGACYVVSVGQYAEQMLTRGALLEGLAALKEEEEPTMVVIPDAVLLPAAECYTVQREAIDHCAETRSRIAILDIHRGFLPLGDSRDDPRRINPKSCIADFRANIGSQTLSWGAAYYPWLDTSVVAASDLSYRILDKAGRAVLKELLTAEVDAAHTGPPRHPARNAAQLSLIDSIPLRERIPESESEEARAAREADERARNTALLGLSPTFGHILEAAQAYVNRLPPSGAIAGMYTQVDNSRGVWKAPANVSLSYVVQPTEAVSAGRQADLNVTVSGKSINAIRPFVGQGTMVWGARTLDGNSLDRRYVNVRRTMIMIEQSIDRACRAYAFEPNETRTWVTIKSMIGNFLASVWTQGGLAGSAPDDAFAVQVGLGESMTAQDVLDGILRVNVLVAITRPAEFIALSITVQMQAAQSP